MKYFGLYLRWIIEQKVYCAEVTPNKELVIQRMKNVVSETQSNSPRFCSVINSIVQSQA